MSLPRKPLSATTARNAALINQLATPGLGTVIAGRWVTGGLQLALAVTGFCFFVAWFIAVMRQFYGQIEGNVEVKPVAWLGWTGVLLFAAAWLWALATSISLVLEARRTRAAEFFQPPPPPKPPPKASR
jgi:hypothetical protein